MSRIALVLLALLQLAGCGVFGGKATVPEAAEDTPDHRACRMEARSSPAMKALDRQRMPMNGDNMSRIDAEERGVFARAYRDCLRSRGLALPGGVVPVQPR